MPSTPKLYAVRDMILIFSDSQKLVLECHEWMFECKQYLEVEKFSLSTIELSEAYFDLYWHVRIFQIRNIDFIFPTAYSEYVQGLSES